VSATNPSRLPLTHADYVLLPDDGRRWELIEGDFHVSPAPTSWHQTVVAELVVQFVTQARANMKAPPRVLPSPIDVMLDDTNTVQPEVVLVRHERRHHLYERFGVPEYWLVDPEERTVVMLSLRDGKYAEVGAFRATGLAQSAVFPDVRVSLEQLFRDL
jgi:Uma2 family endonuclease